MSSYARANLRITTVMKKQMENSREGITWSEMGKQIVQAEKVYCTWPPEVEIRRTKCILWPVDG